MQAERTYLQEVANSWGDMGHMQIEGCNSDWGRGEGGGGSVAGKAVAALVR